MHDGGTECPQVNPNSTFTIQSGPLGVMDFYGERTGRAACTKLYLLWVLILVVCACLVLSAGSVGVIHSQAAKISKALWSARAVGSPMDDDNGDYRRNPTEITVARLREALNGFERQLRDEPRVVVSTRSLHSGEAASDSDSRGGDSTQNRGKLFANPYQVDTAHRARPRASRYDCTPRVDSALGYRDGYGTSSSSQEGRSLGSAALQEEESQGNGLITDDNRS